MFTKIRRFFERRMSTGELEAVLRGSTYVSDRITKNEALNIPAVATSINFVTATIAGLPVKLYKKSGGSIKEVTDDYRLKLLNGDTGDLLDSNQFFSAVLTDLLLNGAGYAYVDWQGNKVKGLYYIDSSYVNIVESVDMIKKSVRLYLQGEEYRDFQVFRVTRDSNNGVDGVGLLEQCPLLFNTMYNALKYENTAIRSGTKRGFLKSKYKLDDVMLDNLKSAWRKLYSTESNDSPDVMVLNEGISFEAASSTASENQLNESKRTNSELVYNLFGLTTNLFSTTTVNSDVYINAIKTGVLPLVAKLNRALNKFLLLESEKDSYFFALDTSEILKSTIDERYKSYEIALKSGWLQVDEVRTMENLPPLGLDFVKLSLADALYYPDKKEIFVLNTDSKSELKTKPLGGGEKLEN